MCVIFQGDHQRRLQILKDARCTARSDRGPYILSFTSHCDSTACLCMFYLCRRLGTALTSCRYVASVCEYRSALADMRESRCFIVIGMKHVYTACISSDTPYALTLFRTPGGNIVLYAFLFSLSGLLRIPLHSFPHSSPPFLSASPPPRLGVSRRIVGFGCKRRECVFLGEAWFPPLGSAGFFRPSRLPARGP